MSSCRNKAEKDLIRRNIISGDIYIVQKVIKKKLAKNILSTIVNRPLIEAASVKILEGTENIFFTSNYKKNKSSEYTAIDKSWYFFTWNRDETGIIKLLQPIYNNVILLNNKKPSQIIRNTPKDILIQRFHLINYPIPSGEISLHRDPVNITQVAGNIYFTEFGEDYDSGGFYVLDKSNNKISVDNEVKCGDMVLFHQGIPHGVDSIKSSNYSSNGRYSLSVNIIESHEKKDRLKAEGIN